MRQITTGIAICLILFGCSTANELRSRAPDISMETRGKHDLIAECVAARLDVDGVQPAILRIDRKAGISYVYEPIGYTGSAAYDIAFSQDGDIVKINARGMSTIYGTDYHPKRVWPIVIECAE